MISSPLHADVRTSADLASHYRQYLRVLNNHTFDLISRFVARRCVHNGHRLTNAEYSALIKPGATFCADEIVADFAQRTIAARLHIEFPTATAGTLTGVNGTSNFGGSVKKTSSRESDKSDGRGRDKSLSPSRSEHLSTTRRSVTTPRVTRINEHVFYHFDEAWRIDRVWSMCEDVSDCSGDGKHSIGVGGGDY